MKDNNVVLTKDSTSQKYYSMRSIVSFLFTFALCSTAVAQTFDFDLTQPQPTYTEATGYGYDFNTASLSKNNLKPMFFSVKVPDGNYLVTLTLGDKKYAGVTAVRAESRRLIAQKIVTKKNEFKTITFTVNKRSPIIDGKTSVKLKNDEANYLNWDEKLTLEFNGEAPAVKHIKVEPNPDAITVYLCGNSTVTDQNSEPWASWGQMIPRWFDSGVSFSNLAYSGLSTTSFLAQNRLLKILSTLKKGDYVMVEFGHNDEKDKAPGSGAWYNFTYNLKRFIDEVRKKEAQIILVTPTARRLFKDGKNVNTHGDYPAAMKAVAERENVPLIDLTAMTTALYEAYGEEGCKHFLVHYPAGTYPGQEKPWADNTHFNTFGAYEVSKCIVMGMKELQLPLVSHLTPDWKNFFPGDPDDWQSFYWPLSPMVDLKKPDGN